MVNQVKKSDVKSSSSSNPLIRCPFCKKRMKGRNLAGHVKRLHVNDPQFALKKHCFQSPFLDGIEVKSPDLIQEIKQFVIDENGFLVLTDMVAEINTDASSEEFLHPMGPPHPIEQSHVFNDIKSNDSIIPGARKRRARPLPSEKVECPICYKAIYYIYLFDHISITHKEQNAKIVLAKFNLEYERLVIGGSSKV